MPTVELLVAIDPGSAKCGVAVVRRDGEVVQRFVIPVAELTPRLLAVDARYAPPYVLIGGGTGSKAMIQQVTALLGADRVLVRDERGTSELARERYWREHPPRGLWRLWPTGLRVPAQPYDDLVAVILAERYFADAARWAAADEGAKKV